MADYVDSLARNLERLLQEGSLPWSGLGTEARRALQGLIEADALQRRRAGQGERLHLVQRAVLEQFIGRRYPHGLRQTGSSDRAGSVRQLRSAKRGGHSSRVSSVVCRVLRQGGLAVPDHPEWGLADLTKQLGVVAFTLGEGSSHKARGRVVTVENEDVFHCFEAVGLEADLVIYTAGRMSERLIDWLAEQTELTKVTHAGDYDPVGIGEYLRLKDRLSQPVHLYVPADIESLFERYSDPVILSRPGNQVALARLHRTTDSAARRMIELIERFGAGLEQEALIAAE